MKGTSRRQANKNAVLAYLRAAVQRGETYFKSGEIAPSIGLVPYQSGMAFRDLSMDPEGELVVVKWSTSHRNGDVWKVTARTCPTDGEEVPA